MFWRIFFSSACAIQLFYWLLLGRGLARSRRWTAVKAARQPPPISVIVAARNEEDDLPRLLDALAMQTHPQFEVVVVDDASRDGTAEVVRERREPHIRLVSVEKARQPRKKRALMRGIRAARHDLLAFTDADCRPPPGWLLALAERHAANDGPTVLVGHGPFYERPGFLNALARYETFITAFYAAAAAGLGSAYMAVGRNLSYPRSVFEAVGGYGEGLRSLSGDDDLFVQAVERRRAARVEYLFDPATYVPSAAKATWRGWLRQKMRHVSAGRHYRRSVQVHLAAFHSTGIVMWLAPFLAGWFGSVLLGIRLAVQGGVLRSAAAALNERRSPLVQPVWDLLYALYNLTVAPLGSLLRPRRW